VCDATHIVGTHPGSAFCAGWSNGVAACAVAIRASSEIGRTGSGG
jgi:hypothetical protein